ncbi:DUF5050 domain-containing protein [Pseudoalteromonas sp. C2R02]|uniref:TolB family protein n=1 Tax=Pseudoalteromonas sp. C2R02 TaxID=2841565 RepID=UPI001C0A57CA|nr:DUF5050 domain-containing protein [Pseudoalteromonas sp. C2R02]MBU2972267.1 DUF5050 domain-containing protein [Pseudoalteromonas sp. C2R02]
MKMKPLDKIKTMLLSSSVLVLLSACQSTTPSSSVEYSLVYGFKEQKSKSIYLSDETGQSRIKIADVTKHDGYPSVSPDGKQVAFYGKYDKRKTWSIHVGNIDGTNMQRLTNTKHVWDSAPAWSADGKTIIFSREYKDSSRGWQEEVWLMNADGTEQRQIKAIKGRAAQFMPDGRILFQSKSGPSQISIANGDGSNIITLTNDDTDNMSPKLSPSGKKIAYLSNRDGNQEVYVMGIDGANQKRLTVNSIQEWDPAWSSDGTKVYFSSQSTHGFYDIYKVNTDGTSMDKVLNQGSQASTVYKVDKIYLKD